MQYLKINDDKAIRVEAISRFDVTASGSGGMIAMYEVFTQIGVSPTYSSLQAAKDALALVLGSIVSGTEIVEFPPA